MQDAGPSAAMPSWDHPLLLLLSASVTIAAAFPVARFFFDDWETFKYELGITRKWERELWLLGCIPMSGALYGKAFGFVGVLAILFMAIYSLGMRVFS